MRYISGTKLQGDIYAFRRLKSKNFTPKNYQKSERITDRAEMILDGYERGALNVRDNDRKTLARYIETFGSYRADKLLDKLQASSDFDVRQYLKERNLTLWQKLMHIDPDEVKQLSVRQLNNRRKQYTKLNRQLAGGWFHKEKMYEKQYDLEREAHHYAANVVEGKIKVTPQNLSALKSYLAVFHDPHRHGRVAAALEKLKTLKPEDKTVAKTSFITELAAGIRAKWNSLRSFLTSERAIQVVMSRKNWAKAAAVSAFFALVGAVSLKSDSTVKAQKVSPVEAKDTPQRAHAAANDRVKTDAFQQSQQQAQETLTAEQKMWKNFYNTKNELRAAALNVDLQGLYAQIDNQQAASIFQNPEKISTERLAYTHMIYLSYGLKSPLERAIFGTEKLTAEQQQQVFNAINTAGENGVGVQKLAMSLVRAHGAKVSTHSAFDAASKEMQAKYISAVKQVKKFKQQTRS